MTSNDIRASFLNYFNGRNHKLVTSAPIVIKNDPSLMFTNAGMNQFKDIFLGNKKSNYNRIANSQKCLRVSGKHNDLEEVGHDTYHHTMFEMLGNWSFSDYFKNEAIEWAWEYLTDVLKIEKSRLYATVFEGDKDDHLDTDIEAYTIWKKFLPESNILMGSKKDNFWEMGETGPCGPCSEIHIDLRDNKEIANLKGRELINKNHPLVIEIWNLVFIQYNRKADNSLEKLAKKHIDTGMGFERLCMVVQGKKSNYDTDIFQTIITEIGKITGHKYGDDKSVDVAMRVVSDHLRAVAFSIADGQLPSNNKAGYVIRRILRRAVRYGYSFLDQDKPFIFCLVKILADSMGKAYPELINQKELIQKVIKEEENTFLKTLANGMRILDTYIDLAKQNNSQIIPGKEVFVLYDTFGFPVDLTELILKEHRLSLDYKTFQKELDKQKNRSKNDAKVQTDDWIVIMNSDNLKFIGYHSLKIKVKVVKYRKVVTKGKNMYHLVFNNTPFYAESGGQVGDTGYIENNGKTIEIINTIKENDLNIHITQQLPDNLEKEFLAVVDYEKRERTECNHSATHLLHLALREILGTHVEQKGSLVHPDYLRFDFSHFKKMSNDEIRKVESRVNQLIRQDYILDEKNDVPFDDARKMGAMALFGEKYDEAVRVIQFGDSIELCGGTHVKSSGKIGYFKILKESAIAAGVRRIEAITSKTAENYIEERLAILRDIEYMLHSPKNLKETVENLYNDNIKLQKQVEETGKQQLSDIKKDLVNKAEKLKDINLIAEIIEIDSTANIKDLAFQLKGQIQNLVLILGAAINEKANLTIMISDNLVKEKGLNASGIIRESAKEINGGGGGQPFFATAGGKNINGLKNAINSAKDLIISSL